MTKGCWRCEREGVALIGDPLFPSSYTTRVLMVCHECALDRSAVRELYRAAGRSLVVTEVEGDRAR